MKLGVSMYSYVRPVKAGELDLAGFIREAKRIDADGVELLDFFYADRDSDRATAKQILEETGLVCGVFSVAQNFAKPDASDRLAELDKIKFGIEEANFYGAKTVRVFAGDVAADGSLSIETAHEWIVEGLTEAAILADAADVRLALENHGRLAGRSDQVRKIIDDVRARSGNSRLGANPDTGNFMLVGQASDEAINDVADLAYMVHLKDFRKAETENGEGIYRALNGEGYIGTVIGEGDVNLVKCLQTLQDRSFDGWVNLEYEGHEGDIRANVEASLANAKRLLVR